GRRRRGAAGPASAAGGWGRGGAAGEQRGPRRACVETVSAQAAPDAVVADDQSPVGLPRGQLTSSAQAKEEATSIAVSCQTAPFVPESRPTKKQSIPTSSPGRSASTCRSGSGCRGGWYGAA